MTRTWMTAMAVLAMVWSAGEARAQVTYPPPADLQTFYVYFLNKGPNYGKGTEEERKAIQAQHMAHLGSLGTAGRIAGPFGTPGDRRGLVILTADSLGAARAIGEADPAVKAGCISPARSPTAGRTAVSASWRPTTSKKRSSGWRTTR